MAAPPRNQAVAAILFLYRHVLDQDLGWLENVVRARRPKRLRVVLSREDVARLLNMMTGTPRLTAALLYGSGLRLMEGLRLRVKDIPSAAGIENPKLGTAGERRLRGAGVDVVKGRLPALDSAPPLDLVRRSLQINQLCFPQAPPRPQYRRPLT